MDRVELRNKWRAEIAALTAQLYPDMRSPVGWRADPAQALKRIELIATRSALTRCLIQLSIAMDKEKVGDRMNKESNGE